MKQIKEYEKSGVMSFNQQTWFIGVLRVVIFFHVIDAIDVL